ncbi:hypothetical protein [Modestobacter sp. NPDC049651]|uniref:hypothetical protein n=1 Tax=unclassified Modestobacter TaxID=2643866 RepID=UPI0033F85FA8
MSGRPEDDPPPLPQHVAVDRFGKAVSTSAHRLGEALREDEDDVVEPVVHRRGGPHRSIDGLAALIDSALEDSALEDSAPDDSALEDSAPDDEAVDDEQQREPPPG